MRRNGLNLIIALLTFTQGIVSTLAIKVPLASIISLQFLFAVPLIIIGIVIYQGVILRTEWRPAIGKGFLAIFLWLFPSYIVAALNFIYWIIRIDSEMFDLVEPTIIESLLWHLIAILFSMIYGLVGIGLCLWVKRRKISKHWLLGNR